MSHREIAIEFIRGEFVPTFVALADAALREPLTWSVLALDALAWWRTRASARAARP
jgi:hypothetical protein